MVGGTELGEHERHHTARLSRCQVGDFSDARNHHSCAVTPSLLRSMFSDNILESSPIRFGERI